MTASASASSGTSLRTVVVRYALEGLEQELRAGLPAGVEVAFASDPTCGAALLPEAEVVFGRMSPEEVATARRLRWVQLHSTGFESMLFPEFTQRGIPLTTMAGMLAPAVAEHALALLLALSRRLSEHVEQMHSQTWQVLPPTELSGLTAVIIGLGHVGREIAARLHAFGVRMVAIDPQRPQPPVGVERVDGVEGLPQALAEAQVVVICCPLTPHTHRLIGRQAFAQMRRDAYVINVSRGGVVDDLALVDALTTGQIAAAGVDVAEQEPLPTGHPLWTAPHLLLTPHAAGYSQHLGRRRLARFLENLHRFTQARPLVGLADLARGY